MKKNILLFYLFPLMLGSISAEDTNEEALSRVLKEAVSIIIDTKFIQPEENVDLQSDIVKVTVPGRAITLRFEGNNGKLIIELTPYKTDDGSYLLTALSKLWINKTTGVKFRSSLKTIRMGIDEQVLFYPLGLKDGESMSDKNLTIELGIKIIPYITDQENNSQ